MIEETEWRVRYQPPAGREVERTGTETQVRSVASRMAACDPVIESRTTLIGEWEPVDATDE